MRTRSASCSSVRGALPAAWGDAYGNRLAQAAGRLRRAVAAERGELDALAARQRGEVAAHQQEQRARSHPQHVQSAELEARALREKADADYLGGLRSTLLNGAARTGRNFYRLGAQGPRI